MTFHVSFVFNKKNQIKLSNLCVLKFKKNSIVPEKIRHQQHL